MSARTLRSALAAGAAVVMMGLATQAMASEVGSYNEADFYVSESLGENGGVYTIYNNSSDWWIAAFAVTNPTSRFLASRTTRLAITAASRSRIFPFRSAGNSLPL